MSAPSCDPLAMFPPPCGPGSTGRYPDPCIDCQAGKYKAVNGSEACTDCSSGSYSSAIGAVSNSTCSTCPVRTFSPPGSKIASDCTCNAGWTGPDGGSCLECVPGKYKEVSGSAACSDCPAGSDSPAASTAVEACTCNVGYSGPDGGSCTACLAGKYKADTGPGACTDCDINTYSEAVGASSESSCQSCPENTASELGSTSSSDCQEGCPPGQTGDPGSCTDCEAGTYKATVGSDSCISCPDNTQSEAGQPSCICNAGFTKDQDGESCEGCAAGKYKIGPGTEACSLCPGKTNSPTASISYSDCEHCPAESLCLLKIQFHIQLNARATEGRAHVKCMVPAEYWNQSTCAKFPLITPHRTETLQAHRRFRCI
jgi:hypothetical protein